MEMIFFILMQIKLIFTRKVVHLTSFWKWGFLELGRGLLQITNLYHSTFEQERTFSLDWKRYILLFGNIIGPLFGATPPNLIWTNSKLYRISPVELWAGLENNNNNTYIALIRMRSKRKFDHITPLLKDLRWLPVKQQLYFRLAVLVFECMTGYAPAYLKSKFVKRSAVSTRTTRNSKMLRSQSSALLMAKGPSNIERRPFGIKELKLSESVKRFKRQRLLLDASFRFVNYFSCYYYNCNVDSEKPCGDEAINMYICIIIMFSNFCAWIRIFNFFNTIKTLFSSVIAPWVVTGMVANLLSPFFNANSAQKNFYN